MKIIVGLGNPGRRYEMTRHNIGFLVLDEVARRRNFSFRRSWRIPAHIAKGKMDADPVRLVKPRTFMNRSGLAIEPILRKTRSSTSDLILIFDDVALEWGQLRIRLKGSAGGHNGVQSVMDIARNGSFIRIRVGIGSKPDKVSLADHVLGPYSDEQEKDLAQVVGRAADAVEMVCNAGAERAMNQFN